MHIREIVKYEDYKRFGTNVKILYEGKEIPKAEQKPDQKKPDGEEAAVNSFSPVLKVS